MSSTQYLLF